MALKFSEFTLTPSPQNFPFTSIPQDHKDNLGPFISFIRTSSPFYSHLPAHATRIHDLPITDPDAYWARQSEVLTAPIDNRADVVTRAGSPMDSSKMVYLTKGEMEEAMSFSADVLVADSGGMGLGLRPGDRVANILHYGSPQGSFTILPTLLPTLPISVVQLPISITEADQSIDETVSSIQSYEATVLLASYATIVQIIASSAVLPHLRLVLYSGTCFTPSTSRPSLPSISASFPNAVVRPSEFASMAAGLLGIPTTITTRAQNTPSNKSGVEVEGKVEEGNLDINIDVNVFKVLEPLVVLEIVADDGRVITDVGVKGRLLVTHLVRRLQPLVRFPMGEWGEWVDYEGGVFRVVEE